MKTEHLTEEEIQQFVLNKNNSPRYVSEHITVCENCRATAASYQLLFTQAQQLPPPAFDFDLSGLVLAQIPVAQTKFSWADWCLYLAVAVAVLASITAFYLFSEHLTANFTAVSTSMLYVIVTTAGAILLFQVLEFYRKYQRQINALNIS